MKKDKKINESLIGKIIYGFLMFAPLLAIMFTSLYPTFNPNAKDSYSATQTQINVSYQYETNEVNSVDDLIEGNIYKINIDKTLLTPNSSNILLTSYHFKLNNNIFNTNINSITTKYFQFRFNTNESFYFYYAEGTSATSFYNIQYSVLPNEFDLYFVYRAKTTYLTTNINNVSASDYLGEQIITEIEAPGTLDNAFYYALDKTEDSTLFNWSKNTGIYTVLYNACNGLGITTTFIPFILTYWLFISLVYLIYDLVLVFVHIAHKKVHELEDF